MGTNFPYALTRLSVIFYISTKIFIISCEFSIILYDYHRKANNQNTHFCTIISDINMLKRMFKINLSYKPKNRTSIYQFSQPISHFNLINKNDWV